MPVEIGADDDISRCIIYDRFFDNNTHVNSMLFQFESKAKDGSRHESAVLRALAPDDDDVHRIGCGIAVIQNDRMDNPPPPRRRYYCGFRTARFGDLPLEGDGYRIEVTNVEEHGESSHVDVALYFLVEGRSAQSTRRTNAGLALAERFGAAIPHICDCDRDDNSQPLVRFGEKCLTSGITNRWSSPYLASAD